MSLQQAAKYLASKGRGEDTVLIHMTPKEVGSLQALAKAHGGSLTVNPHTGLPEAGFLSSILPMVAGAALTPFVGPMGAAMIVGGIQGLRTGSVEKGLMSGLGAYGGAGVTEGLMGMGATSPEIIQAANASADPIGTLAQAKQTTAPLTGLEALQSGAQQAFENPMAGLRSIGGGSALKGGATLGAAAIPALMPDYNPPAMNQSGSGPNPYKYTYEQGTASPFPQADVGGTEQSYFPGARYVPLGNMAGGGIADALTPGQPVMYAAKGGGMYNLGDYSDGGRLLRGPGDGVSDSIPATIGNKRPARLADGEFVVPARIVSELGNGSTEAGARKLYAMMDRVQQARGKTVGKDRVAKNTRADKYLPA